MQFQKSLHRNKRPHLSNKSSVFRKGQNSLADLFSVCRTRKQSASVLYLIHSRRSRRAPVKLFWWFFASCLLSSKVTLPHHCAETKVKQEDFKFITSCAMESMNGFYGSLSLSYRWWKNILACVCSSHCGWRSAIFNESSLGKYNFLPSVLMTPDTIQIDTVIYFCSNFVIT